MTPLENEIDHKNHAVGTDGIDLTKTPLLSHLLELRRRLLYCLLVFVLVFVGCFLVARPIYGFLMAPLLEVFGPDSGRRMIYTGLHEAFLTYLKLSFFVALFLTLPLILNQLWKFIAPGLYRSEQRPLRFVFLLTPLLFLAGAALAYFVVFPMAWGFFLGFESSALETGIPVQLEARVSEYLGLVIQLVLAFGLCFELPLLLYVMAAVGLLDSQTLVRGRRYAVVIIFAAAAVVTPPDLISQIALGLPMLLWYELAILAIRRNERRHPAARTVQVT